MPAKKAPAKKTTTRRAAPAKKAPAKKVTATRKTVSNKDMAYESLWEDELTTQYPAMKKNNFLSLIVLGLGTLLVVVGIYIQINKEEPSTTTGKTTSGDVVANVPEEKTATGTETTGTTPPKTTQTNFPFDSQKMVETFYSYFNGDQFDKIPELYDGNFNTVPGLRQYFNPTRLKNWKANIIGDMQVREVNAVIDHPIVQRNSNAMVVQYKTSYVLKQDGSTRGETWYAYILRGNGTYKLNGFECQENCASSPFFQLR